MVRNMGVIDGNNKPVTENDWEAINIRGKYD